MQIKQKNCWYNGRICFNKIFEKHPADLAVCAKSAGFLLPKLRKERLPKIRALPEQAGNRSGVLSEPAQRRAAEGALFRGAQQYLYQIRSRPAAREKYDPRSAPVRRFYTRRPPGESALIAPSLCARRWV